MAVQLKKPTSVKSRTSKASSKGLSETKGTLTAPAKTGDLGKPGTAKRRPGKTAPQKTPHRTSPSAAKQESSLKTKTSVRSLPGSATLVSDTRKQLGVSQRVFAGLIGVTDRTVSTWESGGQITSIALRRIKELNRLASELAVSMKRTFIRTWLTSPLEALGGLSPLEAMDRGENDRVWRLVFFLGSGIPS